LWFFGCFPPVYGFRPHRRQIMAFFSLALSFFCSMDLISADLKFCFDMVPYSPFGSSRRVHSDYFTCLNVTSPSPHNFQFFFLLTLRVPFFFRFISMVFFFSGFFQVPSLFKKCQASPCGLSSPSSPFSLFAFAFRAIISDF